MCQPSESNFTVRFFAEMMERMSNYKSYVSKTNEIYNIYIQFDTAGIERYRAIRTSYLKNCDGVIIAFDSTCNIYIFVV
jgi:GTPase SAR1 family protein